LRTVRIVVPCQVSGEEDELLMLQCDIGVKGALVKHSRGSGGVAGREA
jgi:hypothetical protein